MAWHKSTCLGVHGIIISTSPSSEKLILPIQHTEMTHAHPRAYTHVHICMSMPACTGSHVQCHESKCQESLVFLLGLYKLMPSVFCHSPRSPVSPLKNLTDYEILKGSQGSSSLN